MLKKLKVIPLLLCIVSGHSMAQTNIDYDYVNKTLDKDKISNESRENIKNIIDQKNIKDREVIFNPAIASVKNVDLEIQEYIIQNPSKNLKEFDESITKAKDSKEIETLLSTIGNLSEHTIYNFDNVSLERPIHFRNEQNHKSINKESNNNKYGKVFSAYNFNIRIYDQVTDYFVMVNGNTNNSYVSDDFKGSVKNDDKNGSGFNNFEHSLSVIGGQYIVMSAVQSKVQSNINEMRLILIKID